MLVDWKKEHDAELGLRREWSDRAQAAENALRQIAHMPTGSRGGYGKFCVAQRIAQQVLDGIGSPEPDPK